MRRLLLAALAGTLTLTACGSTVQQPDTSLTVQGAGGVPGQDPAAALGAPGSLEVPGTAATGGGGTATTGGVGGTGANGNGGTGGGTDTTTDGGGGGSTDAPSEPGAPASGAAGPGVTKDTITIGLPVETGTQGAADAFGVSGASTASQKAIYQAAIDDVNKNGGVLGRKLVGAYHEFNVASAIANPTQTVAEICADFSSDRKVLAVMTGVATPSLRECTAKMGSPLWLLNSITFLAQSEYDKNGGNYLFGVNSITIDRLAELYVDSLLDRRFDEKWNTVSGGPGGALPAKFGVIHVETPDQDALYGAYAKELGKRGKKFAETVTYPQDATQALAATQAAVLRFKTANVTHVFGASAFFLQAAEAQGYRPRYAYLPGLGQIGVQNSPAAQLKGAMTVGWAPTGDVAAAQDPGPTPAASRCLLTMQGAGLSTNSRADQKIMLNICDAVYSFVASLTAGKSPDVAGLRSGFEQLGSGFRTSLTFRAQVGPGRHAGVNSVRDMAYEASCRCLAYSSTKDRS